MENLCYILIAGYSVVGTAIAVLWRAYLKSQASLERCQEARLSDAQRHANSIESIHELIKRRLG
jgi:hypothetical protein